MSQNEKNSKIFKNSGNERTSLTWIFAHWIHGATLTAFTFSIMGGIMLGRLLGMRLNIMQVLLSRGISLEDGTER